MHSMPVTLCKRIGSASASLSGCYLPTGAAWPDADTPRTWHMHSSETVPPSTTTVHICEAASLTPPHDQFFRSSSTHVVFFLADQGATGV